MSTNVITPKSASSPNAMTLLRIYEKMKMGGYSCVAETFALFQATCRELAHKFVHESGQFDVNCYAVYLRLDRANTDYTSEVSVRKTANLFADLNNTLRDRPKISVRVGTRLHTTGCDAGLAVRQVEYFKSLYPGEEITLWYEVERSDVTTFFSNGRPDYAQIVIRRTDEVKPTTEEFKESVEYAKEKGFDRIPCVERSYEPTGFVSGRFRQKV